ncbi:MAG: flagellar biosynthetic protein FliQ [Deltaproteobacteria bacterium]|nr:flagellar biosynthetic protein FliQ [Deltaproteobacteria bacterium]MBN2673068.1 flagellar biosynthetic protein FliQ [Deltaproteobacteria bacterium]
MSTELITEVCVEGLMAILYVIGPPLAAAMAVGLFVAVMQAATQIQESSLTFVPKLAAVFITLLFTGEWSIGKLVAFFNEVMIKFSALGLG